MYQAPLGPRTEAWKPRGVMSARIVADGLSRPRPLYVLISGCFAASPSSITGESHIAKRSNPSSGVGSEITTGARPAAGVNSRAALAIVRVKPARSRYKGLNLRGRTEALVPFEEVCGGLLGAPCQRNRD